VFVDFSILWSEFASLLLDGIVVGAIYALVALGYTLVYGVLRLINFAHSEIFMIGTFASLGVTMMLGFTGFEEPLGILAFLGVFLLVATVAGVASGSAAMLLEVVAYRRLRRNNANRLASLISAMGASLFLVEIFRILTDSKDWDFPRLLEKNSLFEVSTAYFTVDKIVVLFGAFGLMFFLDRIIQTTKLGRGIRAVSQDEKTAILMGVDVDRVIAFTFLIGGVLAGVGSAFYMLFYEATKFNVGFLLGISAFTAAVLGGIGNIRGALAGSFALGIIQQFSSAVLGYNWRDVVTFLILVLVLLFKPTGLFGESLQRARV
jgi:branched-chain amino acid transport system permease protein